MLPPLLSHPLNSTRLGKDLLTLIKTSTKIELKKIRNDGEKIGLDIASEITKRGV